MQWLPACKLDPCFDWAFVFLGGSLFPSSTRQIFPLGVPSAHKARTSLNWPSIHKASTGQKTPQRVTSARMPLQLAFSIQGQDSLRFAFDPPGKKLLLMRQEKKFPSTTRQWSPLCQLRLGNGLLYACLELLHASIHKA